MLPGIFLSLLSIYFNKVSNFGLLVLSAFAIFEVLSVFECRGGCMSDSRVKQHCCVHILCFW